MRFNPPSQWPDPPKGWVPDPGWNPDPAWPSAPKGWSFWVGDDGEPVAGPRGVYGGRRQGGRGRVVAAALFAFLIGWIIGSPSADGGSAPAASTVTSTVEVTGPGSTVTVAAPTETVTEQAAPETITEVAAPETVTEQAAPETVEVTQTETATVEVTQTITEYVEADGDPGGGVASLYDNGADAEPASVYYENCDAARAAGAAPVRTGDPGYAAHLDRDGDGVGCE